MFFINILKAFEKVNRKAVANRILAFVAVLAMAVSLIQPASMVHAADDTGDQRNIEKINSFTDTLVKGAEDVDGKYVWHAKTDADDHRFTFRVDYSMSGVKELEPGAIKIWIPKTILKDRSGKYADYMDISVPSEDEYKEASDEDKKDVNYIWKESTDDAHKNCIEITNVKERTAGENGYFEVAYITNEQTFEYKDEVTYDADKQKYVVNDTPQSDPFYADISVTNTSDDGKPQTVTASANKIPVYINTTAEISSTNKRYPNKLYRQWQSSWGTQPKETEGKYFLVWEIISKIRKDPTQPFTFTINDTPVSKELHLIGYSMNSQSGPFTDKNYVTNQRSDSDHYDYVLTYYDPAEFKGKDYYELKNSVKATVTPEDKIDAPTHATSSKMWQWDNPKFVHPNGHFYGEKYGDNNWYAWFHYYHDYSSYSLDRLQEKKVSSIDTFRYFEYTDGYPYPWTREGDADDPASYGKKPVTYSLSDNELYLEDMIKTKDNGTDQLDFDIPKDAHQLNKDDYQFLYADWNVKSEFRKYDDDDKTFVTDSNSGFSSSDIVHFWAEVNDAEEYKEVATYNLGTNAVNIKDSSVVKELTKDRITFKEDANVTGIKFTTSNAYWYTMLQAYPMVRLKNSDYVMSRLFKDGNAENVTEDNCKNLIRLHNFSESHVYDNDDKLIYHVKNYAFDRAIRPKKESEIHKHIVSTGSNKIRKKYIIRWKITPRETLTTDSGTDYLVQDSGTFYDLLPKGTHLEKGSVDVETEKGMLSHSSFSYSIEEDYKGSGRDMITVKIPVQAKYYNLYLNAEMGWDAIHDYGTSINNPVAYETGNDEIYAGYPDSGGKLSDANKGYMTGLDSKCTTNRFIYDEEPHNIDTLTAAVSGLKKQIKDERDSSYSYETYTTPNGNYSYKIRFANTMTDKAKNMIFFDSLENYTNTVSSGKIQSDWHGVMKRFDTSQLKQMGIKPVVYVSPVENLSIDENHDLTDTKVWQKADGSTDLSKMHAFAIDCRETADGKDFILNEGESLSAVVYMKAPASAPDKGDYAKAYNNIYIQDTIMSGKTSSDFFIHQDYTEIRYRVSADIAIHKQSTDDESKAIEGAKYTLKGKSAYGTEVNEEVTTGAQGNAVFENIEKGTYALKESYSPIDWLLDRNEYKVTVNGDGTVSFGGKEAADKKIVLKDSPRVHGDISFMKYSTAGSTKPVPGAKFRLSGKSKYGTDVMEYATSDDHGKVKFENIEWGDYKLKEVETPDGYIPDSTEHTAVISDSGIGGIEDAEMLKTGSAVIRNEPYHTVEISKQSSYDNAPLSGAEFRLTGTSDYGTPYDKTDTSGENGLAEFAGLEAGSYILQETKSPKDYFLDSTKHIVKVNKDDTYTIDGLKKNESGYYKMNNSPNPEGKIIIVKKKWKDNVTNDKRPVPTIHITTDINKSLTYAVWRDNKDSATEDKDNDKDEMESEDDTSDGNDDSTGPFYYVDPDYQSKTEKVEYAKNITSADKIPEKAVRLDKNYDDENAKYKIWGWLTTDDGTMHYWTNAQTTKLTDGSNKLFCNMWDVTSIDLDKINTSSVTNMSDMFNGCSKLTSLDVSKFDTSHVTSMSNMFNSCESLMSLDLAKWNTSKVTDMGHMFYGCSSLALLDVPKLDTTKVTDMSYMFSYCSSLTSLDVSNFNTSEVITMESMFASCSSLTSLDVSNFDTSKVENMINIFDNCSSLTSLDVSNFDTSNVVYMISMFSYCSSLTSLDVSKFNTSKVENMSNMFDDCSSLTSLDVSKFNTSNVTGMGDMFSGCESLTSLDVTKFDTTNVTDMSSMFRECEKLTSLDLSSFDTSNVTNMSRMFEDCSALTNIYVSNKWNTSKVTYSDNMFSGCSKLHNKYRSSPTDKTHANYDAGGYLTYKAPTAKPNTSNTSFASRLVYMILSRLAVPVHAADSASYVSTDKDCKITKDGDTWTYEFSVADDSAKYYAYEDDVEGYTSSNNVSSYGITTKNEPLTITNTADDLPKEPKPASFSLSKTVDGKQLIENNGSAEKTLSDTDTVDIPSSYSDKTYMFDIVLKNSDSSKLSGTKIFGNTVFTNGKAQVGVKAGETKTFSGLPGGTSYTITEKKYDDFYTESKNASGTLNEGGTAEAKFTNHYQKPKTPDTPKEYSSFTLKKNVTGFFQSAQNYTFDVSFRKLDPNTEYTLSDGTKFTSDADGYGYVQTKLSDKGSVTFTSLPVGAQYKVTEEGGDWTSEYRVTNSASDGDIAQVESINPAEKDQSLSTEWETADKGEDITITFTNTVKKYQSLVLKKKVTGDAPERFKFRIDFTNLKETIKSDAGAIVPEEDNTASAEVYLGGGDEVKFSKIPVTAKYQITELANPGTAEYAVTDENDSLKESAVNTDPMKDLSTAVETVNEDENSTVTFTNTMPKSASIVLKKQVSGIFADKSKFFRFTISVAGAAKNQNYSIDLTNGSSEHDGKKNPMFIKTDANGHGSADVWLKHNDEIVLKNLPLDAKYSITEDAQGYEKSIEANGSPVKDISNRPVAAETVVFTNTNTAILPTGLRSRTTIAMICAAIVFLTVFFITCFRITRKGKNN